MAQKIEWLFFGKSCESADWVGMWKRSNQTGEVFVIILSSFHSSELKRRTDANRADPCLLLCSSFHGQLLVLAPWRDDWSDTMRPLPPRDFPHYDAILSTEN